MNRAVTISADLVASLSRSYSEAERTLAQHFLEEHYDTLLRIARSKRRRAGVGHTCDTFDVMHEAFARLNGGFTCAEHFLRSCVLAMRHVIIDYSRRKLSAKHGGEQQRVSYDDIEAFLPEFSESPEQLVAIGQLLQQLERTNTRWLQVVDARYFSGMTETEAAIVLGLSERTVRRDWKDARDWLASRM